MNLESQQEDIQGSFASLTATASEMVSHGAKVVIAKLLAPHQDNEKNQIYFGRGIPTSQLFPGMLAFRGQSNSRKKNHVFTSQNIVELSLRFHWLGRDGSLYSAPNAKLIEYAQYPETRFSGFMSKCKCAPDSLRRSRQLLYGDRVLVLGILENGILGAVISSKDDPSLLDRYGNLPPWSPLASFRQLWTDAGAFGDRQRLISEIKALVGNDYDPMALKLDQTTPTKIQPTGQAGGWTLEALLGIPRNSIAAPDKYGFEIKSVSSGKVSLITTEPDYGFRHDEGLRAFLNKYGRPGTLNVRQRVFSGIHAFELINKQTGCKLTISNWNSLSHSPTGQAEPQIELVHVSTGTVVAGWSFSKIGASWSKKHAGAFYVGTTKDEVDGARKYRFGPEILIGTGTTALHFLQGVSRGVVYLDPGDRFSEEQGAKKRTQWRIQGTLTGLLPVRLAHLYENVELLNLSASNSHQGTA